MPYVPGELTAVTKATGRTVAGDVLRTASRSHAVRLTAGRNSRAGDGRSPVFGTADVADSRGTVVPTPGP
nr:hypothetical protein [Streptomyces sp. NRRL B-24085]